MKTVDGHWVKPFASGMSCIDTIQGECLRGLSLEECQKKCEASPYCSAGYHISFTDGAPLASYCLPLNTSFYKNTNFLNNLITPDNDTKLSQDNGVDLKVFYDEDRFPDVDLLKKPFIFDGDNLFLAVEKNPGGPLEYLMPDFSFGPDRELAQSLYIGNYDTMIVDFQVRFNKFSKFRFHPHDSLLVLEIKNKKWSFQPFTLAGLTLQFAGDLPLFIDYGTPFFIKTSDNLYMSVNHLNNLDLQSEIPSFPFVFVYNNLSQGNKRIRAPWRTRAVEDGQLFKKNMESFLCDNFPNCKDRRTQPWENKTHRVLTLLFLFWIGLVFIGIGIVIIRRVR